MTIQDIITKLEQAEAGSRELDWEIARALYPAGEGVLVVTAPPLPYTTSIDAALPWENIVQVRSPDGNNAKPRGRWEAACQTREPGHAVYGYGHTEALARRVAALKARE